MKINILGASGAGTTTLGEALAARTGLPYFDSDNFYWEPANKPYSLKREKELRNNLLIQQLTANKSWILGGPMIGWGIIDQLEFDLTVFLLVPPAIRMQRLVHREYMRYGTLIYTDPYRSKSYLEFMDWAAGYDNDTAPTSRTLTKQRTWLQSLTTPVLEIIGDTSVEERVEMVLNAIKPGK